MKRREVITLLGGAAAGWPLLGNDQAHGMPVIGVGNVSPAGFTPVKSQGESAMALASPRLTLRQVMDWCPEPRGVQPKGSHAAIPELTGESASAEGDEENRKLAKLIAAATRTMKANDDPADPEKGPRFIVQWRIFPNAANAQVQAGQCGCGCSCGCG